MKVLFLTPWYPDTESPNHGIFVRDQAIAVKHKHQVVLVSSKVDYKNFGISSSSLAYGEFKNVKEYRISIKKSFPFFNQINYFLHTVWKTSKIARQFKPDVIHGNIGYPGAFWSWMISKLSRRPYLITEHTSNFTNNFRSNIHKYLTNRFLKSAGIIVTVSNYSARQILFYVGKEALVIPNIIDIEKFKNISRKQKESTWHIGFLGGLDTSTKGLDILLRALAKVNEKFFLHIGGKGKLMEEYKALAQQLGLKDKCNFYGFVSHEEVSHFMSRLDFFVSASRFESFGMVIAEAMACGLPVVATKSGGPEDFVNKDNGILVPVNDDNKLYEGVIRMMENYNSFDEKTIKQFVIDHFSKANFLSRIEDCYRRILST